MKKESRNLTMMSDDDNEARVFCTVLIVIISYSGCMTLVFSFLLLFLSTSLSLLPVTNALFLSCVSRCTWFFDSWSVDDTDFPNWGVWREQTSEWQSDKRARQPNTKDFCFFFFEVSHRLTKTWQHMTRQWNLTRVSLSMSSHASFSYFFFFIFQICPSPSQSHTSKTTA